MFEVILQSWLVPDHNLNIFSMDQITNQSDKMLALMFILQFTKLNGYDGIRGLTGIGIPN